MWREKSITSQYKEFVNYKLIYFGINNIVIGSTWRLNPRLTSGSASKIVPCRLKTKKTVT